MNWRSCQLSSRKVLEFISALANNILKENLSSEVYPFELQPNVNFYTAFHKKFSKIATCLDKIKEEKVTWDMGKIRARASVEDIIGDIQH